MEKSIIDIHAHILPGIDDGAKDWEESEQMLDIAISMGIRTIIATPHYVRHIETEKIKELAQQLSELAQRKCPGFKIYTGQEIMYFDSMVEVLKNKNALTLGDSRFVLVEFMPEVTYQKMYQGIRRILQGGYYPVMAHIERYKVLRRDECLQELSGTGCLFQMNYSSLRGHMFDKHVRWCRKQIRMEQIHMLGTDMHHSNRRAPMIEQSMAWLSHHAKPDYVEALVHGQAFMMFPPS